jgi:hypothetical protein
MVTAFIFMAGSLVCVSAQAAVPNTSSSASASKTPYYTANEKSYYMAPDASSSGDGSLSRPFATFKEALSVLKPGDTLILKNGTYKLSDPVVIPESVSGTYSAPIAITAEKKAVINGSRLKEQNGKTHPMITVLGDSIVFKGLCFSSQTGHDACGISIGSSADDIRIEEAEFKNIGVGRSKVKKACANAILVLGYSAEDSVSGIVIDNCYVHNCATGWSEAVSVSGNCENITVTRSLIQDIKNIGIDFSGGYGYCPDPALDAPRNCLVSGNTVRRCRSSYATSYGIYVDGARDITIKDNLVEGCRGGIEIGAEEPGAITSGIRVLNNLSGDNIEHSIAIGGYDESRGNVTDVTVSGNYFFNHGGNDSLLVLSKCSGITLSGNYFQNLGKGSGYYLVENEMPAALTSDIHFDGNIFYGGKYPEFEWHGRRFDNDGYEKCFEEWKSATGAKSDRYEKYGSDTDISDAVKTIKVKAPSKGRKNKNVTVRLGRKKLSIPESATITWNVIKGPFVTLNESKTNGSKGVFSVSSSAKGTTALVEAIISDTSETTTRKIALLIK